MLDKDKIIKIKNRDNGTVGYTIPDLGNLSRTFVPGEEKEITMDELRKLSYIPGGMYILENCLLIKDQEAVSEILGGVEPEYNYSEKEVEFLLTKGTLAQLEDALEFAPEGVVDLIKNYAVNLEINDISKREIIKTKLGFDVTKAIEINKETQRQDEEQKKIRHAAPVVLEKKDDKPQGRRSEPVTVKPTAENKTTSKYKIIH